MDGVTGDARGALRAAGPNMAAVAAVLLVTIVVVPLVAWRYDEPLSGGQQEMLFVAGAIALGAALLCFVLGEVSGNYSQVDRLWSIMPIVYTWTVAAMAGFPDRAVLMSVLVTVWGVRLTYNFARRGGYSWRFWSAEEDYRWGVLRQEPVLRGRLRWTLFNLFFISLYQNLLVLLFTLPIVFVGVDDAHALGGIDLFATAAFIGFVAIETVADQQQWRFHEARRRLLAAGEALPVRYARGFVADGLWGRSRHPNYLAEQAIWWAFYLFTVAASGRWLNWSVVGALLLVLLFQGSSAFSERVSASKYPAYLDYQRTVGRFLPRFR
jgi:steroid 5-alpha reductase family enzyme